MLRIPPGFRMLFVLSFPALLSFPAVLEAVERTAVPVRGERFSGRLVGITDDWKLTFQTGEATRVLPAADLVAWGKWNERTKSSHVMLADGGLLAGDLLDLSTRHVVIGDRSGLGRLMWNRIEIPLPQVRGVVFRPPLDFLARDQLVDRVLTADGSRDNIILENGDVVGGLLYSAPAAERADQPNQQPADLPVDPAATFLHLRTGDQKIAIPVSKALALILNPALSEQAPPQGPSAFLGFRDGSQLHVQQIQQNAAAITVRLVGGAELTTETDWFFDELTAVQPHSPNVTWLSDLKPLSYKHIPYLRRDWPMHADRSVLGGRLRHRQHVFARGLGMHSSSRVAYALRGRFTSFAAELALDASAGRQGSVIYRVFVNGDDGKWSRAFESPIVRGGDDRIPITVDLTGARAMALIVDAADRGDQLDHANWLNARLHSD